MRKILCAAALLGTIGLCGCGKLPFSRKLPDFSKTYTVKAEITYDKLKAAADVTRLTENEWEVVFTEPQSLCGLSFALSPESFAASLDGFSVSSENSEEYTPLPRLITEGLMQLANANGAGDAGNAGFSSEDGVLTYSGELFGKRLTLTADESTGDLISLKCPSRKLSVSFSEQKPFALMLPENGNAV